MLNGGNFRGLFALFSGVSGVWCLFNTFYIFLRFFRDFFMVISLPAPSAPILSVESSFLHRSIAETEGYRSAQELAPYDKHSSSYEALKFAFFLHSAS